MLNSINFTYKGKVNIKVGRKTYSNYNNGDENLFMMLTRFLAGEVFTLTDLPTYIDIKNDDGDRLLNQKIHVTKSYKSDSPYHHTIITTAITDTDLNLPDDDEVESYTLELYDGNQELNRLASIAIDASILKQVATGRQAIIEWYLSFSNSDKDEEGDK